MGSKLCIDDVVYAEGPAMLEFLQGGAVRFLTQGEELEVGDATEAKLLSQNFPAVIIQGGKVLPIPSSKKPIPVRYTDTNFTPIEWIKSDPSTGDYLKAFFTPHGLEKLGQGPQPDGPRKPLPAPPFRPVVPHIHAGDLGTGGPVADVSGGSAAVETTDFATALLLDGNSYDLGLTDRIFVPNKVSVTVHGADQSVVSIEGPAEVHLH